MRTDSTQIPARRRPGGMEPFDAPPGEWLASGRAMWELGKWLVSRDWRMASMLIFFIHPGAGGFIAVLWSVLVLDRISKKEAGAGLAMLPLSSRQKANLIWFMTVLLAPLLYGAIQFVIRPGALLIGEGSWRWVAQIVPECVIAMGLATLIPFARWLSPREDSPSDAWASLTSIRGWLSTFAFVGAAGWVFIGSDKGFLPAYVGMACVSALLVTISYRLAPQVMGAGNIRSSAYLDTSISIIWRSSFGRRKAPAFLGLWWDCLVSAILVLFAVIVIVPVFDFLTDVEFSSDTPSPVLVLPWMLIFSYTVRFKDMDYRVIRCLPLRRSRQALLVLSLVLPFVLPVLAALTGASLYFGWPIANTFAFVAATGGCLALALALNRTIGQSAGAIIGGILAMPLALAFWHWQSPWAMGLYVPYAILLWLGSYAYLYQNLCGDGALFGKRDVIADAVGDMFGRTG